nr:TBC1 domain family 3 [Hymenolepis microstoma]
MRESRSKIFQDILDTQKIDLDLLRNECLSGCPESGGFRSISWKILLNYLPTEKSLWNTTLSKARLEYEGFLAEFISNKSKSNQSSDHPLSSDPSSYWREYFDDNIVLLQINKDCRRLYPELDFFRRPTQYSCDKIFKSGVKISDLRNRIETELTRSHSVATNTLGAIRLVNSIGDHGGTSLLRAACDDEETRDGKLSISNEALDSNAEFHWEVVQRILFTSYKMNRASSYVQGMNEIAAPIYYVFANNPDPNERRFAEPDAFFCFNNLMVEIQSVFNRNFDQDFGIGSKMEIMLDLLGKHDAELRRKLEHLHLEPAHFAFRWITLLLTREFLLPDVLILWDSILADKHRFNLLLYICCSMLILIREKLFACDFPEAVRLLQNYPYTDVGNIISHALNLYTRNCKI